MSGNGLYDPDQLNRLTKGIMSGSALARPTPPPELSVVTSHDFEPYPGPGKLPRAAYAIGRLIGSGLNLTTLEGHTRLASEQVDHLEHRMKVAAFIGDKMLNPRTSEDPAEKISWLGTHKSFSGSQIDKTVAGNLGFELMDSKNRIASPIVVNDKRPVTRSQRRRDAKMELSLERSRGLRRNARWLESSYGDQLRRGYTKHTPAEKKHLSGVARDIKSQNEKATKLENRFKQISEHRDLKGRIIRWRLGKARSFPDRQQERQLKKIKVNDDTKPKAEEYFPSDIDRNGDWQDIEAAREKKMAKILRKEEAVRAKGIKQ